MSNQTKRAPLAERLKQSLGEGIEVARGNGAISTTVVPIGRSFTGEEVAAIRTRRRMSQVQFWPSTSRPFKAGNKASESPASPL